MIATPTRLLNRGFAIATNPMLTQEWMRAFVEELQLQRQTKVLGFVELLEANGKSIGTVKCYLGAIRTLNDIRGNTPYEDLTPDDFLMWQRNLQDNGHCQSTIEKTKRFVKRFIRYCHTGTIKYTSGMKLPEVLSYIQYKQQQSNFNDQTLTRKDIRKMMDACERQRDRAMIHVTYDGIFRGGEITSMKVRDAQITQDMVKIRVNGKTGERVVPLYECLPDLQLWLSMHPLKDDPNFADAPLWISRNSDDGKPRHISETQFGDLLKTIAKNAGIDKHVYPHLLRHSGTTERAKWMTFPALQKFGGWSKDSKVLMNYYIHLRDRDIEAVERKRHGIQKEEEAEEENALKPKKCPRCQTLNSPCATQCRQCSLILDTETALRQLEIEKKIPKANRISELVQQYLIQNAPALVQKALQQPEVQKELAEMGF